MNTSPQSRILRSLISLLAGCALLATAPGAALAAPEAGNAGNNTSSERVADRKQVKVKAKLDKAKVKVNEKVKLKGSLDIDLPLRAQNAGTDAGMSLEPIVVQRLDAGAWVNVASTSCRPNGGFNLKLSFQFRAELTLRVYHPETVLYTSASSSLFTLLVV
jgi:hypothetical protein